MAPAEWNVDQSEKVTFCCESWGSWRKLWILNFAKNHAFPFFSGKFHFFCVFQILPKKGGNRVIRFPPVSNYPGQFLLSLHSMITFKEDFYYLVILLTTFGIFICYNRGLKAFDTTMVGFSSEIFWNSHRWAHWGINSSFSMILEEGTFCILKTLYDKGQLNCQRILLHGDQLRSMISWQAQDVQSKKGWKGLINSCRQGTINWEGQRGSSQETLSDTLWSHI